MDLGRTLESMDPALIDYIHLDVMDGHFVPQLSFGELYSKQISQATDIPLDVHLMTDQPAVEIPKYFELQPYNITFHLEATHFPIRLAQMIRAEGIKAGVALNPGTPVDALLPILGEIDLILIMSVEPGYYGQSFIPGTLDKLTRLRQILADQAAVARPIEVEVDGGVGTQNIGVLAGLGVDLVVAGSACFRGGDVNGNARLLKEAALAHMPTRP